MARALYIHWPFCLAKCPYCDFNSHVRASVDHARWEAALLKDLEHELALGAAGPLESIFFGGGTPSLMPPALVARLLEVAQQRRGFAEGIEITLEANPSSVEAARFADLAAAGVNRVSLGLQSLDDEALKFLGRLHDVSEGRAALDVAQRHFARVSFDLIYALPGQSEAAWRAQLDQALAFGTGHLSLYQLTIEPGTRFATLARQGKLTIPEDDGAAALYEATAEMTRAAGLPAYEISNHARPGEESRHNLTYWRYRDYLGIGPGAHGRRGGFATVRHKKPENWLSAIDGRGHGLEEERPLPAPEQASEALLMGLRLREGVDPAALAARLSVPQTALLDPARVDFYETQGLLWRQTGRLGVTPRGMPVLNALLAEIVPDALVEPA